MLLYALKMLIGDRAKFFGILFGLIFATFVITQQAGIFIGLMQRTYGFISDTSQPDIWVMDEKVQFVDDIKPLKSTALDRVKGVEGVEWAVPMYKGLLKARLPKGNFQVCNVIGIDNGTLIGGPPTMLEGHVRDLRRPDAVIVNDVGAKERLTSTSPTPGGKPIPMKLGEVFEVNDHRAQTVGFCKVGRTFQSQPVVYTTLSRAIQFAPSERNLLTFVLVKKQEGVDTHDLCSRIQAITRFKALTAHDFKKMTVLYFMKNTGIPINFGLAVLLGFIIGTAIAGQTFYNFAHDNLRYFATFKAMGASRKVLIQMIVVQALTVGILGWGIGMGLTSIFGLISQGTELSFTLPWYLYLGSGLSILFIVSLAALISLWKILRLQPAIVFQS